MIFFWVDLSYVRPLEDVDRYVDAHMAYLQACYAKKHFIASGPKVPREGGVILAKMASREALDAVLAQDPFKQAGVADYTITEFVPRMYTDAFKPIVGEAD